MNYRTTGNIGTILIRSRFLTHCAFYKVPFPFPADRVNSHPHHRDIFDADHIYIHIYLYIVVSLTRT